MTKQEMVDLLNELVRLEEQNNIGCLLRPDRREFQYWVDEILQAGQTPKCGQCKWYKPETHQCRRQVCAVFYENDSCSYGERKDKC